MILVKEHAPGPSSLGSANGLAQFSQCLSRAIAPAFVRFVLFPPYSTTCVILRLTWYLKLSLRFFSRPQPFRWKPLDDPHVRYLPPSLASLICNSRRSKDCRRQCQHEYSRVPLACSFLFWTTVRKRALFMSRYFWIPFFKLCSQLLYIAFPLPCTTLIFPLLFVTICSISTVD